jgi:hypothetical protein
MEHKEQTLSPKEVEKILDKADALRKKVWDLLAKEPGNCAPEFYVVLAVAFGHLLGDAVVEPDMIDDKRFGHSRRADVLNAFKQAYDLSYENAVEFYREEGPCTHDHKCIEDEEK